MAHSQAAATTAVSNGGGIEAETAGPSGGSSSPSGDGGAGAGSYWCYQCRKEVSVEVDRSASQVGPSAGMVCVECRSGFVEAASGAGQEQNWHEPRHGELARRRRRRMTQTLSLSDALGQLYPQQLVQVLQMLGHPPRANENEQQTSSSSEARQENSQEDSGAGNNDHDGDNDAAAQGRVLIVGEEASADHEGADDDVDTESDDGEERLLGTQIWDSPDDEADEEEEEDDEDEWEEVEDGDDVPGEDNGEGSTGEHHQHEEVEEQQHQQQRGRARRETPRRSRNLHRYLQEILQNLVGQNIEVRVDLPEYVGNPGDYVDARGFELILQQLAENDNSRRGAPPAARSAVKQLLSVHIEQSHLDDGSALCAVCKDIMCIGELAKQLPCQHLYHEDCILPWLDARNSCPLCRYELPTDDPEYEDMKRNQQQRSRRSNRIEAVGVMREAEQSTRAASEEMQAPVGGDTASSSRQDVVEQASSAPSSPSQPQGEVAASRAGRPGRPGRGWFSLSAGPVISVVGLVLVICLGNHLMGATGSAAQVVSRQQQQADPCLDQMAGSSESDSQSRRRWWWLPFHR